MSHITGDRYWPVQLFGYVRDIALILALIPLPIVLWRRRRHPIVLQLLCAISLLWLPASAHTELRVAPEGSTEVTAMTYNLGNGLAGPDEVIPFIEESGADIIGLQEVSPEVANAIENNLAETYPHQVVYGLGIPGKALLSKHPIIEYQLLEAHPERPDLIATVDINGVHSTVIVAHPPPPKVTPSGVKTLPEGNEQFASLIQTISNTDGPLLLMADLNITQHHDRYDQLEALGLVDAYADLGGTLGYTYPARMAVLDDVSETLADAPVVPLLRIDYIWGSSHWYPLQGKVGEDAGSDHLPVIVRFALTEAPDVPVALGERARVFGLVAQRR